MTPIASMLALSAVTQVTTLPGQWWNPTDASTFIGLRLTRGVPPPGFLDDRKQVTLSVLPSSKAIRDAIKAGNFASNYKPTAQGLHASLKILDQARESG